MTALTFAPFGAVQPASVQRAIDDAALRATRIEAAIMSTTTEINKGLEAIQAANFDLSPVMELLPPELTTVVQRSVTLHMENARSQLAYNRNNLARYQAQYDHATIEIATNRRKLATATSAEITITKAQLRDQLANLPNVVRSSIRLGIMGRGSNKKPAIRWRFSGIIMRPDRNKYYNINGGGDVAIRLPDCVVTVWPSDGEIRISPVVGSGTGVTTSFNDTAAHPHILSGHRPCLGGFQHNFIEGCQSGDIQTIAYTVHAFLSHANTSDGAGQQWPRWVTRANTSGNNYEFSARDNSLIAIRIGTNHVLDPNTSNVRTHPLIRAVRLHQGERELLDKAGLLTLLYPAQVDLLHGNFHALDAVFHVQNPTTNTEWY